MSNPSSYQELNLKEGAGLGEIKAAFRRMAKTYHPDAAGETQADVEKFIKAQSAYRQLLKTALAGNRARRACQSGAAAKVYQDAPLNYRFESRREEGLNVFYRLLIQRPAAGSSVRVLLPAKAQEACPRCLGQGRTLSRLGQNALYRPGLCPRCGGQGVLERETSLAVNLSAGQVGLGKIRLRQAGLYNARAAQRGDLILEVTWVDRLPGLSA
jgi:molecular chaperone DnaJ